MLQKADGLLLNQLRDHITQNGADGVEPLIRGADIREAHVIKQDLLHDKDGHRLAEFRTGLHDPQAERDDLGRQQEIDHVGRVVFHQRADHAEGSQAEIFKGTGFRGRVQEGIEEERDVGCSVSVSILCL